MKKSKFLAGALALTLLAGCGGPAANTAAPTPTPAPPEEDLAWQAAGIRRRDAIVTVDGEPIAAEEYLFWLVNAIRTEEHYGGAIEEEEWADLTDDLKADALEAAKLYRVIETRAGEYGVTLTEDDEAEIRAELEEEFESVGGEEAFWALMEQGCISEDGVLSIERVQKLYAKLYEKLEADGAIGISDADVDAFIEENGIYAAKHILISTRRLSEDGSTYEDFSDEEKAEALRVATDLYDQIVASGNDEALFDELMNQYSGDGRDANGNLYAPDGYTCVCSARSDPMLVYAGAARMVTEFEEGALALEIGGVSEPIQTAYGYHIILRIPVDREEARELYYVTGEDPFDTLIDGWMEEAQVTTTRTYDELVPKDFIEKLDALVAERATARETAEAAETGAVESAGG